MLLFHPARDWLTLRLQPPVVRPRRGITGRPAEVVSEVAGVPGSPSEVPR